MEEGQGYGEPSSAPPPAAAPPPVARSHGRANAALVAAVIALVIALIGVVMFPGPAGEDGLEGPEGAQGADGDDGDDGNDGQDGATGPQGLQGLQGAVGADGADGSNGTACWDLNENGQKDVATEDINGDTVVDVNDCTGLQGAVGPVGPQGPPGTPATVLWAVVESDGSLARGSNVASTSWIMLGRYDVRFNQNVRGCIYVATVGDTDFLTVPPPGTVTVTGLTASVNGVFVATWDMAGAPEDRAFHLTVMC